MKNIVVITVKLLIITVVAGLVLGLVNAVTAEPIAQQMKDEADAARRAAFPDAYHFDPLEVDIPEDYAIIQGAFAAMDSNNNQIGIVASVVTKGYSAGLNLTVGLSADGTVTGVIVGSHSETPGLGAKATEPKFQGQFSGKPTDKLLVVVKNEAVNPNEIVAITGATITSNGVTDAVNKVVEFYKQVIGGAQ